MNLFNPLLIRNILIRLSIIRIGLHIVIVISSSLLEILNRLLYLEILTFDACFNYPWTLFLNDNQGLLDISLCVKADPTV